MKRLLRDKANYVVLEGFLASLLGKRFKIHRFLESEGNQEDEEDIKGTDRSVYNDMYSKIS